MSDFSERVWQKLRESRKAKGYTLAQLAEKCDCSPSLLSQIETGAVNPSLSTLKSICDGLDISMAALVANSSVVSNELFTFMKAGEQKTLSMQGDNSFKLLSKGLDIPFEFVLQEWPPGTSTGKEMYVHEGKECGYLLEGSLEVHVGNETVRMNPGDSITLKSSEPHMIKNIGEGKATAFWVNSEPWVFSTK